MTETLSRQAASDAVSDHGWRLLLGTLRTSIPVGSLAQGVEVAARAVTACGADADRHLRADLLPDRVVLTLRSPGALTARDIDLAHRIAVTVHAAGLRCEPDTQVLQIAIDALDTAAIRPFWRAVLGYVDVPAGGPAGNLVDPLRHWPSLWFQQMDEPRPQRNRIHIDIAVPHDEAPRRIQAALEAGGRLVSDSRAPAWWVLADCEGNEACITTWQGRDG